MTMPLDGIRILDLSRLLPGPYCSMLLSDLGAEVIKFEQPGVGDYVRDMIPEIFMSANRNKKSVTLSLKSEKGREIFYRMVEKSDVVLEGFSPGVTKRLCVDYDTVQKINPKIVYCSISGFGQDGPYRDIPGHDINYLGVGGILGIPGQVGVPPARPGIPIGDLSSSLFAALSILAALRVRDSSGYGQYLDVSMTDGLVSLMSVRAGGYLATGKMPDINEMGHLSPANDIFETKDGKKVTLGALEEHFWTDMLKVLELEEILDDPEYSTHRKRIENGHKISEILKEKFLSKTRDEWVEKMSKARVPCGPVLTMEEVFSDPHILQRGLVKEIDDKKHGKIKQVPFPVKFSKTPAKIVGAPPDMGQHTDEVLEAFGYSKNQIDKLRKEKVI